MFFVLLFHRFRYQDVFQSNVNHLVIGIDVEKWRMKEREKTNNPERVPLLPIAKEIIERYKDHPYCLRSYRLLPVNSNQ